MGAVLGAFMGPHYYHTFSYLSLPPSLITLSHSLSPLSIPLFATSSPLFISSPLFYYLFIFHLSYYLSKTYSFLLSFYRNVYLLYLPLLIGISSLFLCPSVSLSLPLCLSFSPPLSLFLLPSVSLPLPLPLCLYPDSSATGHESSLQRQKN